MALVVFAAPAIERYHLHERLGRELQQDDHEVETLCLDDASHTFWQSQGARVSVLRECAADPSSAPLDELALRECRRAGIAPDDPRHPAHHRRCVRRLSRLLPAALRWFEARRPDLVLMHQGRSAGHHLLQYVARQTGTRVLWTGDGLLPHTLQADERGLDGDAAAVTRHARDYRAVAGEPDLLDACLASTLAGTSPSALSRREIRVPALPARLRDLARALTHGDWPQAAAALTAWRRAAAPASTEQAAAAALPRGPFVALLLQAPGDERTRLDAPEDGTHRELIAAAAAAVGHADPGLRLVVVLPAAGTAAAAIPASTTARLHVVPAATAPAAAAMALATLTVNHPLASVALLAGAPVVHAGRALFGLPGVTVQAGAAEFAPALRTALDKDRPVLRQRFLSWLFRHGHVWCSGSEPDHNGIAGLVQAVESRLPAPQGPSRRYRPGPAWPLAAVRQR